MAASGGSSTALGVVWCYICDARDASDWVSCRRCHKRIAVCQDCLERGWRKLCTEGVCPSVEVDAVSGRLASRHEVSSMCTSHAITHLDSHRTEHVTTLNDQLAIAPCYEECMPLSSQASEGACLAAGTRLLLRAALAEGQPPACLPQDILPAAVLVCERTPPLTEGKREGCAPVLF